MTALFFVWLILGAFCVMGGIAWLTEPKQHDVDTRVRHIGGRDE